MKPGSAPTSRAWVEVPARASDTEGARPKYSIEANAFIVYRKDNAYVSLDDRATVNDLAQHSDVRVLTESEGLEFEESLPFYLPPPDEARNFVGLGDVISWLARKVGIDACSSCQRRRTRLNKVPVWGWWN